MARALDGVVVLDFTTTFWGSLAAALLGDFGAEVLRVDDRGAPRPPRGDMPAWDHRHELANRNKRALAVDLGSGRGREIAQALAAKVDVVLTDLPLARLQALGLDYASVAAVREDIIYARGSGLGPKGPDAGAPALDEIAAARTGMMPILGQPGQPPVYPGHGQTYTTIMLALGVVMALYHRRATGFGQEVDTSLLAGNMYAASLDLQAFLAIGGERFLHPVSRLDAGNPMSGTFYPTSDGRWVALTMPDTDRWWPLLAEVTGLDAADARFATHDLRCGEHRLALLRVLDEAFRCQSGEHWRRIFAERQMSADVIEDYAYPAQDADARRNRYLLDLDDPSLGPLTLIGFPIWMSDTPARLDRRAPLAGQHGAAILHERLGYSEEQIAALARDGVIGG